MINLLYKDLKLLLVHQGSTSKKVVNAVFYTLFIGLFIFIEVFVFSQMLDKFKPFEGAPLAFISLFLMILSVLFLFNDISLCYKLFFNDKDQQILANKPISDFEMVFSKLILIFVVNLGMFLIFVYPILVSYGIQIGRTPTYYWAVLFYPTISFFFEAGVALFVTYPYFLVRKFLDVHPILRIVVVLVLLALFSVGYLYVLNLFVSLVSGGLSNSFFSEANIQLLRNMRRFEIPSTFLVSLFLERGYRSLIFLICGGLGIFLVGLIVFLIAYRHAKLFRLNYAKGVNHRYKQVSPMKALIKKESILLFRGSSFVSSFVGILAVSPAVLFFVLKALNSAFSSSLFAYMTLMFPNVMFYFDLLIVMLFVHSINAGASSYLTDEKRGLVIMRTIPVSYSKQLYLKMLIPYLCSFFFLGVSMIVAGALNVLAPLDALLVFIVSAVSLFCYDLINLIDETKRAGKGMKLLSVLTCYLLPLLMFLASLLTSYFQMYRYLMYFVDLGVLLIVVIPTFFYSRGKIANWFMDSERMG